jgi:DNA-binding HxlR family transcriptional regulator
MISKKTKKAGSPPKRPVAGGRRSYRQYCGLAKAMDALGERWTLLIARDLMLGPRRYGDILRGLKGITTNLLAARLKDMESMGILAKQPLPPPGRGLAYALTDTALKRRYLGVTLPITAELDLGGRAFQFRLGPGYPDLREGKPWMPDFHVRGEPAAFLELFYRGVPAGTLVSGGRLAVTGSAESWRAFLAAFGLAA